MLSMYSVCGTMSVNANYPREYVKICHFLISRTIRLGDERTDVIIKSNHYPVSASPCMPNVWVICTNLSCPVMSRYLALLIPVLYAI